MRVSNRLSKGLYLSLHLHGEILEHVVQVSHAPLQLQDLVVPGLDLIQSLLGRFGVDEDLSATVQRPIRTQDNDLCSLDLYMTASNK